MNPTQTRLDVVTVAKRFPPYVFSTNGNATLVHRVASLQLQWYWWDEDQELRYQTRPHMTAIAICGQMFHEEGAQLCQQPNPEAQLCGRCQGLPPPFGKFSPARLAGRRAFRKAIRAAHRKLVKK